MTIHELFEQGKNLLTQNRVEDSEFDCICIFETVLGIAKADLYLNGNRELSAPAVDSCKQAIERRCNGVPLQYILGEWDFYDMTFYVGDGVLIPRPETEFLVEIAEEYLRANPRSVVYDLCCGSGCIGLALANRFPDCHFILVDLSKKALLYAEKNRARYRLTNVELICYDIGNGYAGLTDHPSPDIIVANPPYIPSKEISSLQKEVQFEPHMALDGGTDGLDFYHIIAEKWLPYLNQNGLIAVEAGEGQPPQIAALFREQSENVRIYPDCYGVDRFSVGRKGS